MTISTPQVRKKAKALRRGRLDPLLLVMAVGFALAVAAKTVRGKTHFCKL